MPDWQALVEGQLGGLALEPGQKAEVIAELAVHLVQVFEECREQGLTEEEAVRRTLSHVEDWQDLRRRIQTFRAKESIMNNRVRQFWLPSLLTLLSSMGLLILIQFSGPNSWPVAPEHRSGWSLIAPVPVVYLLWLLSLPLIGALGAFFSRRSGGSQRAAFSSIVFPVLPYLVSFLIGLPMIVLLNPHIVQTNLFNALFIGLFAWVLAPAAGLLVGGLLAKIVFSRWLDSRRIAGG
jgi:hypothetical protein